MSLCDQFGQRTAEPEIEKAEIPHHKPCQHEHAEALGAQRMQQTWDGYQSGKKGSDLSSHIK